MAVTGLSVQLSAWLTTFLFPWWRNQMETFSALLAIWAGYSPVTGEFPTQRPVTRSFDVFYDLCLNKRLNKQWWGWWFETSSRPLWRHCNVEHWLGKRRLKTVNLATFWFWTLAGRTLAETVFPTQRAHNAIMTSGRNEDVIIASLLRQVSVGKYEKFLPLSIKYQFAILHPTNRHEWDGLKSPAILYHLY